VGTGVGVSIAAGEGAGGKVGVGATIGMAAVVALMLAETVASILGVGAGVRPGVAVAAGPGSVGIAAGEVDPEHAVRDASTTRINNIKDFLYQLIQGHLILLQIEFPTRCHPGAGIPYSSIFFGT